MDKLRILPLALACGLLSAPSFAANGPNRVKATTYDVSESFTGIAAADAGGIQASFTGSFTFNPQGTGLCSALICAPGVIPDFLNVNMSGTATPGGISWGPDTSGQIALTESGNTLTFYNFNGFPSSSSFESTLDLTLTRPLGGKGGKGKNIATSAADYCFGGACSENRGDLLRCAEPEAINNTTCTGDVDRVGNRGRSTRSTDPSAPSGVPEPGTFALLAMALAGFWLIPRRGSS